MTETITFARGVPSMDLIDTQLIQRAAARAIADDSDGSLLYGPASGYAPLRQWLAERHGVDSGQVLLTNGSMQGCVFVFDLNVGVGDTVAVESPTYDRTLADLARRGARVMGVAMDEGGLSTQALEAVIASASTPIRLLHVIPNFQNPAGSTLSLTRRLEVLRVATQHGILIFEDDPYRDLHFGTECPPSMLSLGGSDGIVYSSSFSKTVSPGPRVGFLIGSEERVAQLAHHAAGTYISPSVLSQAIVYRALTDPAFPEHLARVRATLETRCRRMVDSLRELVPDGAVNVPDGGYFCWLELPSDVDPALLRREAAVRGVAFVEGSDFLPPAPLGSDPTRHAIRLSFAGTGLAEIERGIHRLAEALTTVRLRRAGMLVGS